VIIPETLKCRDEKVPRLDCTPNSWPAIIVDWLSWPGQLCVYTLLLAELLAVVELDRRYTCCWHRCWHACNVFSAVPGTYYCKLLRCRNITVLWILLSPHVMHIVYCMWVTPATKSTKFGQPTFSGSIIFWSRISRTLLVGSPQKFAWLGLWPKDISSPNFELWFWGPAMPCGDMPQFVTDALVTARVARMYRFCLVCVCVCVSVRLSVRARLSVGAFCHTHTPPPRRRAVRSSLELILVLIIFI